MNFANDFFQPLIMVCPLTLSDYLSNIGGIMGLVAGISVMSIVEIFYHILMLNHTDNRVHILNSNTRQTSRAFEDHVLFHLIKYITEFIKTSDLHGFPYITDQRQSRRGRIFWAIFVAASLVACLFLIRDINRHAEKSPVAIRIDSQLWTLDDVRNFCRLILDFI
jgi:Amiloride-sensitive sodium channel